MVGLSSFLLISYWYTRIEASLGGLLAFTMNRIGDIFFLLGIFLSLLIIGSVDLLTILSYPKFNSDIILIFFLFAAMAKSAQLYIHIWLPYSMEGWALLMNLTIRYEYIEGNLIKEEIQKEDL